MFQSPFGPRKERAPEPRPATSEEPVATPELEGTERQHRELSLLSFLELSNELNALRDVYEIAEVALFNLMGHFGSARGAVWVLPEDSSQDAVLVRSQGIPEPVARAIGAVWTRWLLEKTSGDHEPILVSDLRKIVTVPGLDLAEKNGISMFAPITAQRRLVGVVALGHRVGGGEFGALDREVLEASLNLLGVALENTNLYNRMQENNRRLRNANEKLHGLDRLKSEFIRNMNHELRTPLTIMNAYLDSMLGGDGDVATTKEHLTVVKDHAQKLEGMLLNLLDYSKLMDDRLEMAPERGDVGNVIAKYYEDRRPGISADLREFRYSAASDVPPALFERERLIQIVDSLVDNALKFTPQGSQIHLRVESDHDEGRDWVRVDVEDDGPGIPDERLPHIFDSFRQGDGSETRQKGGMGLGLAFARTLAERMDGRLDVESQIGKGTVFSLRLPAA